MERRVRFAVRLPDGEGMSEACREFGASRKLFSTSAMEGGRRNASAPRRRMAARGIPR